MKIKTIKKKKQGVVLAPTSTHWLKDIQIAIKGGDNTISRDLNQRWAE